MTSLAVVPMKSLVCPRNRCHTGSLARGNLLFVNRKCHCTMCACVTLSFRETNWRWLLLCWTQCELHGCLVLNQEWAQMDFSDTSQRRVDFQTHSKSQPLMNHFFQLGNSHRWHACLFLLRSSGNCRCNLEHAQKFGALKKMLKCFGPTGGSLDPPSPWGPN